MTEFGLSPSTPAQLSTIAELRWRLVVNSLRSTRGKLELLSQVLIGIGFAAGGLGGATGLGFGAYMMIAAGRPELLALPLWFVFFFWQAFPVLASAFSGGSDSSDLLRFPLRYRSYFLLRMAYGAFDPASVLGSFWLFGMGLGIGFARPALLPWTILILLAFVLFNLLFLQMIFAWVERWLAQRRTRELMGILFILFMLSFQLIGPLIAHLEKRSAHAETRRYFDILAPVQRALPPGLAADAIAQALYPHVMASFNSFALLCGFILLIAYTLHVRLLAQYRGENLSEVAASALPRDRTLRIGWNVPGVPIPVAAVFEKEFRFLMRSGPVLITLVMPIFALLLIRFGAMNQARNAFPAFARLPDMAFPAAAAYAMLMLTNLICNSFGADGAGIQFYFAAPISFREIVLAKNLSHACILVAEITIAFIAVSFLYGPPAFSLICATLAGLLFAAPLNFAVGNLLSIYAPKKVDYSSFRNQKPRPSSALITLAVQLFIVGIAGLIFSIARYYDNFWIATIALLALSGISLTAYRMILNRIDGLAVERQETLLAELCRV